MSVLPLVDFLILCGTGSVVLGFLLKAVALTTTYRPSLLGFGPLDMLIVAGLFFGMALVLTARTWMKLNEPHLQALQRRLGEEEARRRARAFEERNGVGGPAEAAPPEPAPVEQVAAHR